MFWLNLNCKFEFFLKKYTVGAVDIVAAPANRFVGPLQIDLYGRPENRPYKYMIYRDGLVEAAGQTVPTKSYQPKKKTFV